MIGRVFLHTKFPVESGTVAPKRFIVINNPKEEENWLVVKTTSSVTASNQKLRPDEGTCHLNAINVFRLEANQDPLFEKPTWVQFYVLYELKISELRKHNKMNEVVGKGKIEKNLCIDVLECMAQSEDIATEYIEIINQSIQSLKAT